MESNTRWLVTGQEVLLVGIFEDKYLIKEVIHSPGEEPGLYYTYISDEVKIVDEVFSNPPTEASDKPL